MIPAFLISEPLEQERLLLAEKLTKLDSENLDQFWPLKTWEETLVNSQTRLFLLHSKDDYRFFSCCLYASSFEDKQVHLLKMATTKGVRRYGFAKKLLSYSREVFRNEGFSNCFLEVSTKNTSAINLYNLMGFKVLHEKKRFYSNGENAYSMQLYF